MKRTVIWVVAALTVMPVVLTAYTTPEAVKENSAIAAAPAKYTLTVLSPQGPIKKGRELAPRLKTLEGKKLAMWLSATPDQLFAGKGAELYDVLAKMLKERIPDINIVPYRDLPMKFAPANEIVTAIAATRPDAVVAAFGG
jgi:hypothetical protein